MQPTEENTFNQVPWFATTQTGSIDLYASAVFHDSSNIINHSNNTQDEDKLETKSNSTKVD